ncbi:MAG: TetR/AcrR family transcriptional regulator, partial [Eubacterium sp.]
MTTKEKIAEESLNLFSTKGFNAVSVRDIARAVGIKESSIYNHYKNKQAIFDSLVETYAQKTNALFKGIAETEMLTGDVLSNMSFILCQDALVEIVKRVANAYITDPYIH